MKVEQQTTAGSDRIRSLYSPGKTYNLVYIITHDYSTIEFRNLWRPSPASLRRGGGAGPLHIYKLFCCLYLKQLKEFGIIHLCLFFKPVICQSHCEFAY